MGHSKLIDGPIGLLWLDHIRFFFACVVVLISIYRVDRCGHVDSGGARKKIWMDQ
jgi:hypothetical protein